MDIYNGFDMIPSPLFMLLLWIAVKSPIGPLTKKVSAKTLMFQLKTH